MRPEALRVANTSGVSHQSAAGLQGIALVLFSKFVDANARACVFDMSPEASKAAYQDLIVL